MRSSRLRVRLRYSPFAVIWDTARRVALWSLVAALVLGGYRYFTRPFQVGALDFTPHVIGVAEEEPGVQGMAAADLDNDGDVDIVYGGRDGVRVFINDGSENFSRKIVDARSAERVQVIDLNDDTTLDLLVTLKGNNPSVVWYDNKGHVEFQGTNIGTGTDGVAYAGDIDGDGAPDVVTALNQGGNIVLQRWMNDGGGSFTSTTLDANSGVTALTVGDIDGNGFQDIVTGGSGGLQRWKTDNGADWTRIDIDDGNQNRTHIVTADVNKDGKTDIVTADAEANVAAFYRNVDNATWQRVDMGGGPDAKTVAVKDLDEDGDEDIIVASQDENAVYWYDNNGSTQFTKTTIASNLQSVYGVAVADIDSDGDFDFVTGDHMRGTVWWYERMRARPVATKPDNIQQATDGSGRVTFQTTVSDEDGDPTRLRIQYSRDGVRWDKPWLTKVTASAGSVDLKNSNGFQAGTANPIDTNDGEVTLTFTWDTKSVENTGGPLKGDMGTVRLRVLPRDDVTSGTATESNQFRVDLAPPQSFSLKLDAIDENEAQLTWNTPEDSSAPAYRIYYGGDHAAVLEQRSEVWDSEDDEALSDSETTSTTISDLSAGNTYTFKLFAKDKFGNEAGAPSARGIAATAPTPPPVPPAFTPAPGETPTPSPVASPTPTPELTFPTPTPTPAVTPTPTATSPTTLADNTAPIADAGVDQVVNSSALVILDGTASNDPDNDSLTYSWRQLAGPSVDLLSERTATPSFSAGVAGDTYIFQLTTRDPRGALGTETVTIAVRALPEAASVPVEVGPEGAPSTDATSEVPAEPSLLFRILRAINLLLFLLSVLSTAVSFATRLLSRSGGRRLAAPAFQEDSAGGKLVHFQTGEPIVGAQVLIYGSDGKLRKSERTEDKGRFPTLLPAGTYTIGVQALGFTFAPASAGLMKPDSGVLYTGGALEIRDGSKPVKIVIPMKPTGKGVATPRARLLHFWQATQRIGRVMSWPIFLAGALLNTLLVFRFASGFYLTLEILYVVLVIFKVVLEVRVRPAYGMVRDAITHVPLDLAVVRLYESGTNRLIMTRVTNAQGKFFALPPAGKYTVTITKPGYAVFSKGDVEIRAEADAALQLTADLMPVAPPSGLAGARAKAI